MKLSKKKILLILFVIIACVGGYSRFIEPYWLDISREEIDILALSSPNRIRILHMSDMHAGGHIPYDYISETIDKGLSYNPDLILITGDFIDKSIENRATYVKLLKKLSSAAPVYASLGNHDGGEWVGVHGGYFNTDKVLKLLKDADIIPLINETANINIEGADIALIGIGDLWAKLFKPKIAFSDSISKDAYKIVLSHNPDGKEYLKKYKWDLMLSGHTHGGQLYIPLIGTPFAPVQDKKNVGGLFEWNGRQINISRGIGNFVGFRFACRPEISILDLY